uniref:Uncharacterized protein n=1 Tax=Rhizophora mucronata TaxID=61149 RepID=A0A2P2PDR1_RHIMU
MASLDSMLVGRLPLEYHQRKSRYKHHGRAEGKFPLPYYILGFSRWPF